MLTAGVLPASTGVSVTAADPLEPNWPLADHAAFVDTLPCAAQAKSLRSRGGTALLDLYPDLAGWMTRPVPSRLADVRRVGAWPLLCWCFATGRLRPDLDLLAGKGRGAHFTLWLSMHAGDEQRARAAAEPFGWCHDWVTRVVGNALPLACLTRGRTLLELTEKDLDAVEEQIAGSRCASRSSFDQPRPVPVCVCGAVAQ